MPVQGSLIGQDMRFFSSKANNLSMIKKKIKCSSNSYEEIQGLFQL
jgi:hypothetical protein